MTVKEPHIGLLIDAHLRKIGMTKAELGRRINTSRQNVNTFIRSQHVSTRVLIAISNALNYNFFKEFMEPDYREYLNQEVLPGFIQLEGVGLTIQLKDLKDFTAFMNWWTDHKLGKDHYEDGLSSGSA